MTNRILVIEDDAHIRMLLQATLRGAGYDVILAANGTEAEQYFGSADFNAVILDLMLPDTSGREILIRMKKDPFMRNLPVLVLSVKSLEAAILETLSLGAGDYVKKPFNPRELVKRLEILIQKAGREKR